MGERHSHDNEMLQHLRIGTLALPQNTPHLQQAAETAAAAINLPLTVGSTVCDVGIWKEGGGWGVYATYAGLQNKK